MFLSNKSWVIGAFLTAFLSVFFFLDLGQFPIFQWDEARYVNNSVEVLTLGNWFNFTMDGAIDTWNFKPPLVLWLQAGAMKVFGINEWAVRLPSALASVGIGILLYWFCVTALRSVWTGVAAVLFYGASCGFIGPHMGRSADLDAVQTLFSLWYVLLFVRYIVRDTPQRNIYLWLAVLVVSAFLCKGMPGLLLLPYLFLISLLHKNHRKVYFTRSVYVYAAIALSVCIGYYVLRDLNHPGYWELVKKSEFNRFSGKGVEWHKQPTTFYLNNFIEQKRYFFLLYLLPFTLSAFFIAKSTTVKRVFLYFWIITLGYFLFISTPAVKLEWYDAPLYPCFALLFAIAVNAFIEKVLPNPPWQPFVIVGMSLILCFPHYRYTWGKIQYSPDKTVFFEREGLTMRELSIKKPEIQAYTVFMDKRKKEHLDQVKFYQKAFARDHNAKILIKDKCAELVSGELVLLSQPRFADSIKVYFPLSDTIFYMPEGHVLRIK